MRAGGICEYVDQSGDRDSEEADDDDEDYEDDMNYDQLAEKLRSMGTNVRVVRCAAPASTKG